MKLTTSILAITITMASGAALTIPAAAQNADAIDNARSTVKAIEQKENAGSAAASKPAPGAPAPAVKPAVIPGATTTASSSASTAKSTAVAKTSASAPESAPHNQLKKVNVIASGDSFRIEMVSSDAVAGKASALKSPDRVLVELPGTIAATRENRIAVGNGGIKGIRIGTDGKNPPNTSVVVDLQKACAYELTPGPSGTLVLTVHTDAVAQNVAPPAAKAPAPKPIQTTAKSPAAPSPKQVQAGAKSTPAPSAKQVQIVAKDNPPPAAKPVPVSKATKVAAKPAAPAKIIVAKSDAKPAAKQPEVVKAEAKTSQPDATADLLPKAEEKKPEEKKWAMTGKRDPFFSPVVQQGGSGCSTGKKCLEIGTINLRGVVKSDSGFIAVVTNNLNKAYFLRENDPVFNGYVVKITGDSVVFQETVEDKLGKSFTREVVKRIFTPAV
jgi:Tfp pilus assembly protein PilP